MFKKISLVLLLTFLFPLSALAAKLSIDPVSKSVKVGDAFTLNINLNTENQFADGVDIHFLNYDKDKLEVQGSAITVGTLFSMTPTNSVDAVNGRINFSQAASGGTTYNGSGVLATISFKALKEGSANLSFDYTASSTIDSNVASVGNDILNGVVNGVVTITAVSSSSSSSSSSSVSSSASTGSTGSANVNQSSTQSLSTDSQSTAKNKKLVSTGPAASVIIVIALIVFAFTLVYLYVRKDTLRDIHLFGKRK